MKKHLLRILVLISVAPASKGTSEFVTNENSVEIILKNNPDGI